MQNDVKGANVLLSMIRSINDRKYLFIKVQVIVSIVVMIPLLFEGWVLNYKVREDLQNSFSNASFEKLQQATKAVDMMMENIVHVAKQVYPDKTLRTYLTQIGPKTVSEKMYISNKLEQIKYSHTLIHSVYLYDPTNKTVFSTDYGLSNIEAANDTEFINWYVSEELGNSVIDTRPIYTSRLHAEPEHVMSVYVRLPYVVPSHRPGALIINISQSDIYSSVISTLKSDGEEQTILLNEDGSIIMSQTAGHLYQNINDIAYLSALELGGTGYYLDDVNGKRVLITYTSISSQKWTMVNIYPFYNTNLLMNSITVLIFGVCALLLFLSLSISAAVFSKVFKPIDELLEYALLNAPEKHCKKKKLDWIKRYYINISKDNAELQKRLETALPQLRARFLSMLLQGIITNEHEIEQRMQAYGIDLSHEGLYVCIIGIREEELTESDLFEEMAIFSIESMVRLWLSNLGFGCYTAVLKPRKITVIFYQNSGTVHSFCDMFAGLNRHITGNIGKSVSIGICDRAANVVNLAKSYQKAQETLNYEMLCGKGVCLSSEVQDLPGRIIRYPYQLEESMLIMIRTCQYDEAIRVLRSMLLEMNVGSSDIGLLFYQMVIQLNNALINLMIEMSIPLDRVYVDDNAIHSILKLDSIDEIDLFFAGLIGRIIEIVSETKQNKQERYYQIIKKYIAENYHRPELTLELMSDEIMLSHVYINQILKANQNITFVPVLNRMRIEKAQMLLQQDNMKIKDVAEMVGYSSSGYFIKVFKEVTGFTPGQLKMP